MHATNTHMHSLPMHAHTSIDEAKPQVGWEKSITEPQAKHRAASSMKQERMLLPAYVLHQKQSVHDKCSQHTTRHKMLNYTTSIAL